METGLLDLCGLFRIVQLLVVVGDEQVVPARGVLEEEEVRLARPADGVNVVDDVPGQQVAQHMDDLFRHVLVEENPHQATRTTRRRAAWST
jgi:hypothetical protein